MHETIKAELKHLESMNGIRILLAVESGSRAWGFASNDSDWDVRFIYIHDRNWYLSIDNKRDNMEAMLPGNLDLAGWELRKALKLFRKSNPPLLEWLQSPIHYMEQFGTARELRLLASRFFNPKACIYHYLSMAKGNFNTYLQHDTVRIKKYFYALRPVLACKWIETQGKMAPMEFRKLLDNLQLDGSIRSAIDELLSRKTSGDELDQEPQIKALNDYLQDEIQYFEAFVKGIDPDAKPLTDVLDTLFRRSLDEVWGNYGRR